MENSCVEKFSDFAATQTEQGKSANTIKTYCYALQAFANWLLKSGGSIDKLTRVDVQQYIKYLEASNKSAATIGKVFAAISAFAQFKGCTSITEGIRFPVRRKALHIAPKSLNRNERNKLLRDVERNGNIRNLALIFTLLFTGLRVSELVSLDRNDIKFGERSGSVTVRKGKGDISRVVPLPVDARHYLSKYLDNRNDEEAALFLSQYQQRISIRSVQRMLQQYGIHPHQLRHTYCRELANAGIDLSSIAELAGHSDTNTTRRYSKPSHDELEQAVSRAFG